MTATDTLPATAGERRVLIVDDHPVVAEGWGRIVRNHMPCEIFSAFTALEGWQVWRRKRPDMIVVDLTLGDSKSAGIKLIERIRRADADLPILVFTMHASAILAKRALRSGAQGIINKDSPPDEIVQAFQDVAAGGHYVDSRFARQIALMDVQAGPAGAPLTAREEEILQMIGEGLSYRDIAERACISYKTVSNVSHALRGKLGATNLSDLVVKAIRYFE